MIVARGRSSYRHDARIPSTGNHFFVLRHVDVFADIASIIDDLLKHLHDRFIRTTVQGPPQGADAGGNRGKEVGIRRTDHPNGRRTAVLLVIRVHDQYNN
jgi:hypothetical protein